jgi:acyl-CoA dehydrogenase
MQDVSLMRWKPRWEEVPEGQELPTLRKWAWIADEDGAEMSDGTPASGGPEGHAGLHDELRAGIRALCQTFDDEYWRKVDREHTYPSAFVDALTEAGWLSVLIPSEFGGGGLGIVEACIVLEEINRSGGNAAACHAQMYTMGALLRHGTEAQKAEYLPKIASGDLRLQAFGVTEPDAGSDSTSISTFARREGDTYVINGRKVWTSRVQHSDLMLLLARTTPIADVQRRGDGLSLFLIDLRDLEGMTVRPIETMVNHETNEVTFDDVVVPVSTLVGTEGRGFKHVLDGMNAERILIASESIGDAHWFIARASAYASQREVFGRPIGANQGVAFPLARSYAHLRAAEAIRDEAASKFDRAEAVGTDANLAKFLASEAAWEAANAAMTTFGGYGMAVEYDIERKFRESRLYLVAPVSNNLVLAHLATHALGLPKSY